MKARIYNEGLAAGIAGQPTTAPAEYRSLSNDWQLWQGGHAYGTRIMNALTLAETALEHSKPTMAHYTEPVERHREALEAVRACLPTKGNSDAS